MRGARSVPGAPLRSMVAVASPDLDVVPFHELDCWAPFFQEPDFLAPFEEPDFLAPFQEPDCFAPFQEPESLASFFQEPDFLAPLDEAVVFVRGPDRGARDCGACSATVFLLIFRACRLQRV